MKEHIFFSPITFRHRNGRFLWPVFNNMVYPHGGELCPLGGMFTPSFTPRGERSLLFRRMEGQAENFNLRG
jgi:hypothetical protein